MGMKQRGCLKMKLVFAIILFVLFQCVLNQSDINNFGPYKMEWEKMELCKGLKAQNCGNIVLENTQDPTDLIFRLDIPKECPVTATKIIVSNRQNNSTKKLWNYVLNKPCEHFVLGPLLKESFNLTSSCKINKGNYTIHLNLAEKSKTFLGTSFFYGSYIFKVMSFNKVNNFFCFVSWIDILK